MKVLYDHQAFTIQHFGGVSKCFCELISHLPENVKYNISCAVSNNIHLNASNLIPGLPTSIIDRNIFRAKYPFKGSSFLYEKVNAIFPSLRTAENLNKRASIDALKSNEFDVFHPTAMDDYFIPYLSDKPFVITIHDMMPELYPQYYGKNNYQVLFKKKYLNRASAIIAVSENTKKDIVELLDIPEDKIYVIPHGGPNVEILDGKPLVENPYFLYVGTRNYYKNYTQTIKDFSLFAQKHKDVSLVCTGPDFTKKELAEIENFGIAGRVVHKHVNDEGLKNLYANAIAFIFPSLYEGFGLPILEAYAFGCPVLLNNKSCFPEIAGDAAIYFNSQPGSSDLLERLEIIYNNESVRCEIISKGYDRLSCFSWEKSAKLLATVYSEVSNRL